IAAGDINGDGIADIICGADAGGGPNVTVFKGAADLTPTKRPDVAMSFFPYDMDFTGGVRVASADVDGDGIADVVTGAGPGGGPNVTVYKVNTGVPKVYQSYFAYDMSFNAGIYVASGDTNADGRAEVMVGAGSGGGPNVAVFDGRDGKPLSSFFPYEMSF